VPLEIGDHDFGVLGDIGDVVHLTKDPVGVDQEAEALREVGELVARIADDAVRAADLSIDVAEQTERELLIGGEPEVVGGCVERGADDDRVQLAEAIGSVTQALTFDRSTGRRRLWVPPQQHPRADQVGEADEVAVLVGQLEIGRGVSGRQHPPILSPVNRSVRHHGWHEAQHLVHCGGATERSLTQLPWNPNGTRRGSGTRAT
jgi:hypothetical protein